MELVRPDRRDEKNAATAISPRQWIEAVYDTCKDQLNLEGHCGRTIDGGFAGLTQPRLALAAVIWHNGESTPTPTDH